MTDPHDLGPLRQALRAGPLVVLTGAGMSTASGIPAYRDAAGQWQHPTPIQHQAFLREVSVRRRYWARSFVGWPRFAQAQPNGGHEALATLEHHGHVHTLITQNVDGLHQAAGSQRVIELHGGLRQVRCLGCGALHARSEMQRWLEAVNPGFDPAFAQATRTAPDGDAHLEDTAYEGFQVPPCPACGEGVLKPDVVFYGDNVPLDRVAQAVACVEAAAGLLVVGSSLMVYSGYRFAVLSHQQGKPVIAINQGLTRADALLTAKIEGDCSAVLQALISSA